MQQVNEYKIALTSERQMARGSIAGGPAQIVLFFAIWLVSPMKSEHSFWAYALCISTVAAATARTYLSFFQRSFFPKRRKLWSTLFHGTSFWTSSNWGALGSLTVLFYQLKPTSLMTLLSVCGVSAGASATLFYKKWVGWCYVGIAILPGVIMEMSLGTTEGFGTALVSFAYFSFLILHINQSYKMHRTSLINQESATDQKNRLQAALQGSLDSVLFLSALYDKDKNVTDFVMSEVNVRAGETMGKTRTNLVGANLCELFPYIKTNGIFERYVSVLQEKTPLDEELQVNIDGHLIWLHHQVIPLGNTVVTTFRDITERKRAEIETKNQQQKLGMILSASRIGTWDLDIETGELKASDSLRTVYGLDFVPHDRSELINLVYSGHRQRVIETTQEAFSKKSSYSVEFKIVENKGTRWICEIGHPSENGYLGLSMDISERKESEKLIEEQKLRISESAKLTALGEMAGGIAHEINNPLTNIKVSSQLIETLAQKNSLDPTQVANYVREIEGTVDRIAKVVKALRLFSREASQDPYEKVTLRQLLDEALPFCKVKFEKNNVNLVIECDCKDVVFYCQKTQILQVLVSLLHNAFDAVQKEKEKWVKITAEDNSAFVNIAVTDSGHGISKDIREKIMQPFFTTKEVGKGTGLGLSVSKGIVESHNGALSLDTTCSNTRFLIRLPKQQKHVTAA